MPDAFDILGLEARFDLTAAEVRAAYLARVGGEEGGSRKSEGGSGEEGGAALNAAKTVLMDAEGRANLLLARLGGPGKDACRELPDGFLMTMMEAREELEAASAKRDSAGVERWREWAEGQRDGHVARVGALFKEHLGGGGAGGVGGAGGRLTMVRRELNAWRYIERMLEQIGAL